MTDVQAIYIYMDDSGKLSNYEKCSCYGGLVFLSKKEKDKFITQYRSIVRKIKCDECNKMGDSCDNICPEIKNAKIKKAKNKRWIMNYIKKYSMFCCLINNKIIKDYIINSKSSKGRYLDYAQKMLVKEIFMNLIREGKINPNKPIRLTMYIDEQTTKSNGYYNLKESIKEEFLHGIINYNYGVVYEAILHSSFEIDVNYVDSKKNYAVQAADFVTGESRNIYLRWLDVPEQDLGELLHNYAFIKYLP